MEILARGVGRRKEAVAQVQIVKGTGQFIINNIPAQQYLHNNTYSIISIKSPLTALNDSALKSDITQMMSETALKETADNSQNGVNMTGSNIGGSAQIHSGSSKETPSKNVNPKMNLETMDTIVKVKGGGLVGQAEAIKLGLARALCQLNPSMLPEGFTNVASDSGLNNEMTSEAINGISEEIRRNLKEKGYLTQDSRVKERRKYGLKKARKATQYNKR